MQARLIEAQSAIRGLNYEAAELEEEKAQLQTAIKKMSSDRDIAGHRCHQMEEKAKNFDKIVAEWESKIDSLQAKLDQTQVAEKMRSITVRLYGQFPSEDSSTID